MNERIKEITAMPRKELNHHAFLMEQEEYEKELASIRAERDRYKEALEEIGKVNVYPLGSGVNEISRILQSALKEE